MKIRDFQEKVVNYYRKHGRHNLPWRKTRNPYKILVSEMMLQQTQVSRVIPKYKSFLEKFGTVETLAKADLSEVLKEWQGLGYNRRAVYLKKCAEKMVNDFSGKFPQDLKSLMALPGIGTATAGDILAFAWNKKVVVIETNIRSVFIHHFFPTSPKLRGASQLIHDKEILSLIEKTLPTEKDGISIRDWYYALMDYGAFLKESISNNAQSRHYVKQSPFKGSNREKRSTLLKLILEKPRTEKELIATTKIETEKVKINLMTMIKEGLIKKHKNSFMIA